MSAVGTDAVVRRRWWEGRIGGEGGKGDEDRTWQAASLLEVMEFWGAVLERCLVVDGALGLVGCEEDMASFPLSTYHLDYGFG